MSDTQQAVASLTQNKLTEIEGAVIKAFKPLINAKSVSSKSIDVEVFEFTKEDDNSYSLTAIVHFNSEIEPVEGFKPTYAAAVLHIDFSECYLDSKSKALKWKDDNFEVTFNYGFYSYNLTWGVLNADGSMDHNNGEAFGIDSKSDDDMSNEVMGSILDLSNDDPEYQGFLQAVFNRISKQLSEKL